VTEANVPDIRARFDALARRYAARGFVVLWNGQRYAPGGGVSPIPAGQDQHHDHMHVEAPVTIVGKPTQASYEAAQAQEEKQAATLAREQADFVSGIVDQQGQRGLAKGPESLQARMDKIVNDYKRRFNVDTMSPEDQKKIRDALIGGDAREVKEAFDAAYVRPIERLKALQGTTGIDREILNAQLEESVRQFGAATEGQNLLSDAQNKQIENSIRQGDQLQRENQILQDVRGPLEQYRATIAALNDLLAKGTINQTAYNAKVAELAKTAASTSFAGLQGKTDPGTGKDYEDLTAIADENARYAEQLKSFQDYREQLLQMGVDYNALEEAAAQQHQQNLAQIDYARRDVQMATFEQAAHSVTSIMQDAFGKQSKIARAAFVAEKAVAIARAAVALAENVAQATKIGFPQNIPFIAGALAQGATIMASIRSAGAAFQGGSGYKEGGWTGDGRVDEESGPTHGQEFVVKAPFARQNRSLLEAINSGRQVRQERRGRNAAASDIARGVAAPVVVPPAQVGLRVINVTDPRAVADFFETAEGEQVFVNLVGRNSETIRRAAGGGIP
jgi:hypothetical protein